jgi:hypothetical protein
MCLISLSTRISRSNNSMPVALSSCNLHNAEPFFSSSFGSSCLSLLWPLAAGLRPKLQLGDVTRRQAFRYWQSMLPVAYICRRLWNMHTRRGHKRIDWCNNLIFDYNKHRQRCQLLRLFSVGGRYVHEWIWIIGLMLLRGQNQCGESDIFCV